jgi:REP element-mobilizing transposase RayT
MANTYTQLYFHVVFAVKGRLNLISSIWKEELYQYISGIISNKKQKLLIINGAPDHVHMLIGLKPDINLSDLIRDIKANSSRFINEKRWVHGKFEWQLGFGAFTLGQSQSDIIINYIRNQESHHQKKSFKEEYIDLLNHYNVIYKAEYLFEDIG